MRPPSDLIKKISEDICRPTGTVTLEYSSPDAFRVDAPSGGIIEIPAGAHYFRLDRTADRVLRFFHSSPSTGTRFASIDLRGLPHFEKVFFAFSWSPEEIRFLCKPRDVEVGMLQAVGAPSPISFRVAADGTVHQLGDEGFEVMGVRIQRGDQILLAPTAIEVWQSTLLAVELLWTGQSDHGFMFEVLQTTSTLSMLVTGLENYGKTRLMELEKEGISPDTSALFFAFASKAERESARFVELQTDAAVTNRSVFETVVENIRINFQNLDDLKRAFRAAYGVKLAEIGIDSNVLGELRRLIGYRHRIIHVSPTLAVLNLDRVPSDAPVFANRALSEAAVAVFRAVIDALHKASIQLRPEL
jgi:hypothetical protein